MVEQKHQEMMLAPEQPQEVKSSRSKCRRIGEMTPRLVVVQSCRVSLALNLVPVLSAAHRVLEIFEVHRRKWISEQHLVVFCAFWKKLRMETDNVLAMHIGDGMIEDTWATRFNRPTFRRPFDMERRAERNS